MTVGGRGSYSSTSIDIPFSRVRICGGWDRRPDYFTTRGSRRRTCPAAKAFCHFSEAEKKKKSHTEVGKEFPNDGEATVEMVAVVVVAAFSIGFWVEGHRGHTFAFSCERESIVGRRRGGSTFPRFHVAGFSAR